MAYVLTRTHPPPPGVTLAVRSTNNLFFAAYCKWQNKWFHLHNGTESECGQPEFWWDETIDKSDLPLKLEAPQEQLTFF